MKTFNPRELDSPPRADMFLPNWLNAFGIFLDAVAIAFLVATFITQIWWLLIGFLISGGLGIAAHLCWKNQTIRIIDETKFEYTTFLGNKKRYYFSEIKQLAFNQDSLTLFVGGGKVHIESSAIISEDLFDMINAALVNNYSGSDK